MRRAIGLCAVVLLVFATAASAAPGVALVKHIWQGPKGSHLDSLTDVEGTLFFGATDRTHGDELWKSDGTEAGTVMVKDNA